MIISRTPFRISFFGGGTDYPDWYLKNGGSVLSTTFDKYCYVSCRKLPPFFDHKYRIAYSIVENAVNIDDINHPAVRATLKELNLQDGMEIHADADLPARSGLGSSSSFLVGLINALYALEGKRISKKDLALLAINMEQNVIGDAVGSQDQVAAAYGGFNQIIFNVDGTINVDPVIIREKRKELLNEHLMLFFTGFSRIASNIAKSKINNLPKKEKELCQINLMVNQAINILLTEKNDIRHFGELLDLGWVEKKKLASEVTTDQIDDIYIKAKLSGAIGGKLLGAGGGGFLLLFVEPKNQNKVRKSLGNLIHVPIKFEKSGSQIIYYE